MKTFLIEKLELPNLGHMTTSAHNLSHVIEFCWWCYNLYFKNTFISRKPREAYFADIIKIETMFIKTTFIDSKKVKGIRNHVINTIYICVSWYNKSCWFSRKKMMMSTELKRFVTWFIYFLDLLSVRHNCATFYHCRICVTDFRERGLFKVLAFKSQRINKSRLRVWG